MANNTTDRKSLKSFKDFILDKEAYRGKWGETEAPADRMDWSRAEDAWDWPDLPFPDAEPDDPEFVARDDDPKDALGSMSSPGQSSNLGLLKKLPPRGKQAGKYRKSDTLQPSTSLAMQSFRKNGYKAMREYASGLSDAEYIEFMMEQIDHAKQARPITLVSDLNGNQFTPSPEEAFRYVATLSQNPMMLARLVASLKDTGVLADLVHHLADDRDAMNGLVAVLGDPDSGPPVAGRLAKAMYDQMTARQSAGAQVDMGAMAEAVAGPVWQDAPMGFDNGEAGQDGTGEQTEDTDDQNPNLPQAEPEPAVPGEGGHDLDIGGDMGAQGPDDSGFDMGVDAGTGVEEPTSGGEGISDIDVGDEDDDLDAQVGSFSSGTQQPQASSAARHLVQAMMRYKPLADLAKSV